MRFALRSALLRKVFSGDWPGRGPFAISPDGRVALVSSMSEVSLIDLSADSGSARVVRGDFSPAWGGFSGDGRSVYVGDNSGVVGVWGSSTLALQAQLHGVQTRDTVAALDRNGRMLAVADQKGRVTLWSVERKARAGTVHSGVEQPTAIAFGTAGRLLALGGQAGQLSVCDARSGKVRARLDVPLDASAGPIEPRVADLSFSLDDRLLAVAYWNNVARVWDIDQRRVRAELRGHRDGLTRIRFSADGATLLTGSFDRTSRLWDRYTGRQLAEYLGHRGALFGVGFADQPGYIVTVAEDRTIRVWNPGLGVTFGRFNPHAAPVVRMAYNARVRLLATGALDGTVQLHSMDRGITVAELPRHADAVTSLSFDSAGRTLVSSGEDGIALVWDVAHMRPGARIDAHAGPLTGAVLSADGERVVTAGTDRDSVWAANTGALLREASAPAAPESGPPAVIATSLAVSPRNGWVASVTRSDSVRVWDADNGVPVSEVRHESPAQVLPRRQLTNVAFAPDGEWFATWRGDLEASSEKAYSMDIGDTDVQLWESRTGKRIATLSGHNAPISSIAVSQNGTRVATASLDRTARVFDLKRSNQPVLLTGHEDAVSSVAFSSDGRVIATTGADHTIRVWEAGTGKLLDVWRGRGPFLAGVFVGDAAEFAAADALGNVFVYACELCGSTDELLQVARARITATSPASIGGQPQPASVPR